MKCVLGVRITRQILWVPICVLVHLVSIPNPNAQESDPFTGLTQEQVEEVFRFLTDAEQAEADERWLGALELYQRIWEIAPAQAFRFRQGVCLEGLERIPEALEIYRELQSSSDPGIADSSTQRAQRLEELLASLPVPVQIVTGQPGATVTIDDAVAGVTEGNEIIIEIAPGEHRIAAELEGFQRALRFVSVVSGQENRVEILLEEQVAEVDPVVTPDPNEEDSTGQPSEAERSYVLPIVLGSVAVAAGVTGIVFGISSSNYESDYNEFIEDERHDPQLEEELRQDSKDLATAANICYVAAGALAIGAVAAFFLDSGGDDETEAVAVAPLLLPDAAGGVFTWTF